MLFQDKLYTGPCSPREKAEGRNYPEIPAPPRDTEQNVEKYSPYMAKYVFILMHYYMLAEFNITGGHAGEVIAFMKTFFVSLKPCSLARFWAGFEIHPLKATAWCTGVRV